MVQSQEAHSLTVSKLAAAGGVGVETIRFYQRRGLLDGWVVVGRCSCERFWGALRARPGLLFAGG